MKITTVGAYPVTVGWVIALLVLVGVFVLWLVGSLEPRLALLLGGLALARLT